MQADPGGEVRYGRRFAALLALALVAACANPRAVLVNDKGEYITCAGSGIGMIGSIAAQSRFENCMDDAKGKGYRVERQE
jgi:hypothetical protein